MWFGIIVNFFSTVFTVGTLCAHLLPQFYINQFETVQAFLVCTCAYGFGIIVKKG